MNNSICIIGTGGFAREVLCLIDDLNLYSQVHAFMESYDTWEKQWKDKTLMGKPVLPMADFKSNRHQVVIGVGDTKIREKITKQLPLDSDYKSIIHPTAVISKWVKIGEGAIITAGCILTCQIEIGNYTQLNLGTTIGHDCKIGNFFTAAPSVNISGACNIGDHVYFGTGAATKQGVNITDNVSIGMGAMVVKDLQESGTYVGIPAKITKYETG